MAKKLDTKEMASNMKNKAVIKQVKTSPQKILFESKVNNSRSISRQPTEPFCH